MSDIDTSKIGQAAAEMMEVISESGYPDGSVVLDVMVITCIHRPNENGEIIDTTTGKMVGDELIDYWCTEQRLLVQVGILEMARAKAEFGTFPSLPDPDGEDDD